MFENVAECVYSFYICLHNVLYAIFSSTFAWKCICGPDSAIFNHAKLPLAFGGIMHMLVVAESGWWRRSCSRQSKCAYSHSMFRHTAVLLGRLACTFYVRKVDL